MDKPWKVILAFVGVFMAGAVFGGLFTLRATGKRLVDPAAKVAVTPAPAPTQPGTASTAPATAATPPGTAAATAAKASPQAGISIALMRQFTRQLKLTNTQRDKIKPLVDRAADDLARVRKRVQEFNKETSENTGRVMERMYEDVAAWLTPEQRRQLDEMREQLAEKQAEARKKAAAEAARKADALRAASGAKEPVAKKAEPSPARSTSP